MAYKSDARNSKARCLQKPPGLIFCFLIKWHSYIKGDITKNDNDILPDK